MIKSQRCSPVYFTCSKFPDLSGWCMRWWLQVVVKWMCLLCVVWSSCRYRRNRTDLTELTQTRIQEYLDATAPIFVFLLFAVDLQTWAYSLVYCARLPAQCRMKQLTLSAAAGLCEADENTRDLSQLSWAETPNKDQCLAKQTVKFSVQLCCGRFRFCN